jgi:hypothetical protein
VKKEINYEDNLFFLVSQIEQLSKLLKLNLDGDFLCDKYILDVTFFDKTLTRIEKSIVENNKLINFPQYLQLLRRARSALEELLMKVDESEKELAIQFRQKFTEELDELIQHQQDCIQIIISRLKQSGQVAYDDSETIGAEEMQLLTSQDFYEEDQQV